jgi:hypothetical protein
LLEFCFITVGFRGSFCGVFIHLISSFFFFEAIFPRAGSMVMRAVPGPHILILANIAGKLRKVSTCLLFHFFIRNGRHCNPLIIQFFTLFAGFGNFKHRDAPLLDLKLQIVPKCPFVRFLQGFQSLGINDDKKEVE